jgi:hypothetical protein
MKNEINLFEKAREAYDTRFEAEKLEGLPYFDEKTAAVHNLKKAVLMLIPGISEAFGRKLAEEEEVLMNLSDMLMQLYGFESTLLRVKKIESMKGTEASLLFRDILDVLAHESSSIIMKSGIDAIVSFAAAEQQNELINAMQQLCRLNPINVKDARRRIAEKLIEENRYCF